MSTEEERESLIQVMQRYLLSDQSKSVIVGKVITIDHKDEENMSEYDKRNVREFSEWIVDMVEKALTYDKAQGNLSDVPDVEVAERQPDLQEVP